MTKHIISINRHNFYQYLFPSNCLEWGYFISAWITDDIYIKPTPINIFIYGFDPHYNNRFYKFWTCITDIIIWQQK